MGYPLDTVKVLNIYFSYNLISSDDYFRILNLNQVRLQTQDAKNPVYRGTFHCLQSIVQQESVSVSLNIK